MNAEKLFDMLPCFGEIIDKLGLEDMVKNAPKDMYQAGTKLIKEIMKNSRKVKAEFFEMIAIYKEMTTDEAKKLQPAEVIEAIQEIFKEAGVGDFFKSAIR